MHAAFSFRYITAHAQAGSLMALLGKATCAAGYGHDEDADRYLVQARDAAATIAKIMGLTVIDPSAVPVGGSLEAELKAAMGGQQNDRTHP